MEFTVNSPIDAVDANPGDGVCATAAGECTLRASIQETNAIPGADTINLPAGIYTLTIFGGFDDAAVDGDLDITDELEIRGAGAANTVIDGGKFVAFIGGPTFEIRPGASAVMSDVTIQNGGEVLIPAGGILNSGGTLTLNDVIVSGNVGGRGAGVSNEGTLTVNGGAFIENGGLHQDGAISNVGTMTLDGVAFRRNGSPLGAGAIANYHLASLNNVTVEENITEGIGAGIYNGFEMTVTNSTIKDNIGGQGTGIFNEQGGSLTVRNTTISGNTGTGAIATRGAAIIENTTITGTVDPVPGFGGAIYNDIFAPSGYELSLTNTIVADSIGEDCGGPSAFATISYGHNLSSDGTCPFNAQGDMMNTDPLLGPLADNGGPTQTHALLPGSPAIDAGDNAACPAMDQRGVERPLDGDANGVAVCDIGAYEAPGAPATTPSPTAGSPTPTPGSPAPIATETPAAPLAPPPIPGSRLPAALPPTGGKLAGGDARPEGSLAIAATVAAVLVAGCALGSRASPRR